MKKIVTTLLAATMLMAFAGTAAAQDRGERSRAVTADTNFTFEDHAVAGDRDSSAGERIISRTLRQRHTLVRPRTHFVPELMMSVERI